MQATFCNWSATSTKKPASLQAFLFCRLSLLQCSCVPIHHAIAAMKAEAGMVNIQAQTILPAIPHRTADIFFAEPTPTIAPVMVCVVDTGMPSADAMNKVIAPPVSAQNPPTGLSLVIFWPMVLTMRHPPTSETRLVAKEQEITRRSG